MSVNDDVFRKLDEAEKIRELADELCGGDEQAAAFVHTAGRELQWTGVRLMWVRPDGTRTVALSDPEYKPHVKEKYGFLLKPEKGIPEGAHLNVELDPPPAVNLKKHPFGVVADCGAPFEKSVDHTNPRQWLTSRCH
jgi:hypothetical protein